MSLLLLFNQRTLYDKTLSDTVSLVDNSTINFQASISYQHSIADTLTLLDGDGKDITTITADIISFVDSLVRDAGKHNSDSISFSDNYHKDIQVLHSDILTLIDDYVKDISIQESDVISLSDIIQVLFNANYFKELFDIVVLEDFNTKDITTELNETTTLTDDISNEAGVVIDDIFGMTDDLSKEANLRLYEVLSFLDEALILFNANIRKILFDSLSISDELSGIEPGLSLTDLLTLTDGVKHSPNIFISDDSISFADATVKTFNKAEFDIVTISEYLLRNHNIDLSLTDQFHLVDSPDQYHPGAIILETITANGPITIIIEKPSTVTVITYTTEWTANSFITTNIVFQSKIAT